MMKLTILRLICVLLIVAAVGLYVYGVVVEGDTPTENLLRSVIIALSGVSALMKLNPKRKPLSFYAEQYPKELGEAFKDEPKLRERLLEAVRLYNEDKGAQTIRILKNLQPECREKDDHYAVGLFTAIAQTDMGLKREAIATYEGMIARGAVKSQIYSNLGMCYMSIEDNDKALNAYQQAIHLDPQNAKACSNLANLYFQCDEYEKAEEAAQQALRIDGKLYQASTLLAILHALQGDQEESKRYFDAAVSAGQNEETLANAIRIYLERAVANEK